MMFNVWILVFSSCFLINIIYTTQNLYHGLEYNCTIETVDNGVREKISRLLEDGKKVIFLHLLFTNQINPFLDTYRGDMYRPLEWVRIAGRHGRSLLFLRPEFEQLSLTTLSLETGHMDVSLIQKPDNCLLQFNVSIVEDKLRDLLLSDFKPGRDGGSLSEHEYICNKLIRSDNSNAQFFYRCCHKGPDGNIVCENLIYDYWIHVVFICVIIISFVAMLFCPYLIPDSFYREKYGKLKYELQLENPLQVQVLKRSSAAFELSTDANIFLPIKDIQSMTSLRKTVKDLQDDRVLTLLLDKIHIAVQYRRLVPANYVPVGIVKTFYAMFVKCHIAKTSTFRQCCSASIFGNKPIKNGTNFNDKIYEAKHPWIMCLKPVMRMLILIGICLPWIVRIVFFYWYEKSHLLQKAKAASERNMTLSLQWNLTNTFTPIHTLFLICYIIIVIDALVFGMPLEMNIRYREPIRCWLPLLADFYHGYSGIYYSNQKTH